MEDEINNFRACREVAYWFFWRFTFVVLVYFFVREGWFSWVVHVWSLEPGSLVGSGVLLIGGYFGLQQWHSHFNLNFIRDSAALFRKKTTSIDESLNSIIQKSKLFVGQCEALPEHPNKLPILRHLATSVSDSIPEISDSIYGEHDAALDSAFSFKQRHRVLGKELFLAISVRVWEAKDLIAKFALGEEYLSRESLLRELGKLEIRLRDYLDALLRYDSLLSARFNNFEYRQQKFWWLGVSFPSFNEFFWEKTYRQDAEKLFKEIESILIKYSDIDIKILNEGTKEE